MDGNPPTINLWVSHIRPGRVSFPLYDVRVNYQSHPLSPLNSPSRTSRRTTQGSCRNYHRDRYHTRATNMSLVSSLRLERWVRGGSSRGGLRWPNEIGSWSVPIILDVVLTREPIGKGQKYRIKSSSGKDEPEKILSGRRELLQDESVLTQASSCCDFERPPTEFGRGLRWPIRVSRTVECRIVILINRRTGTLYN